MDLFDLTGKVALVTGGSHGLGMAIAKGLAKAGARIAFNDILEDRLRDAADEYRRTGVTARAYRFDVTKEREVIEYVAKIEKDVGPIDILVNNAGIIKRIPMLDMSVADFEEVVRIDLVAPFIMAKHVVKSMLARGRGGKIINMCSMMSELGRDTVGAYAAAKGGLKMLTKNMATEWAKHDVQANGIGPGYFATSQTAPIRVGGHPFNEFILNRTPAGRWGDPDDLQGAAIFLASRASDFVNGQIIYVDGGILATIGKPRGE
ncbi:MAG: gluconate 5-dehydrogenase [Vicinamibacteria bacterium]|nr:gluconate 5-dehydrogenase [Vicinamibacteria bacterium]